MNDWITPQVLAASAAAYASAARRVEDRAAADWRAHVVSTPPPAMFSYFDTPPMLAHLAATLEARVASMEAGRAAFIAKDGAL